jgi:nucleotide-binding universal stress UspA family protein
MFPDPDGNSARPVPVSNPFRQVLVGWDGSPDSVAALRTAAAMVGDGPGRVIALAVLPRSPNWEEEPDQASADATDSDHMRQTFETARSAIATRSHTRISLHTEEGRHAARSLCDHATEHGFDLLVIGRHGDGGLLHSRLGHVAEAAARASKVPVLLISAG